MISINIQNKWQCYFFVNKKELTLLLQYLRKIHCDYEDLENAKEILNSINSGVTFTNFRFKTFIVVISDATNREQWFNTLVHELKHVQSHICEYYNISESGEQAAYLIGYLMQYFIRNL